MLETDVRMRLLASGAFVGFWFGVAALRLISDYCALHRTALRRCFFAALMLILAMASATVGAAEPFDVQVFGPSQPSLWRFNNGPWQSVPAVLERGGWAAAFAFPDRSVESATFDLRPGGVPWFSTHTAFPAQLKELAIAVGERQGAYQQFSYNGESRLLPVVEVPEPSSWLLAALAGLGVWKGVPWLRRS